MTSLKEYILAIDCGTQSLGAIVFDRAGRLLAREQVTYPPYVSPGPGLAEQDPMVYWNALKTPCQSLKAENPKLMAGLAGVGITTQRATMINVHESGKVLRPAIVWLDQRRAAPVFAGSGLLRWGAGLLVLEGKLMAAQCQAKCNWIIQNQPGECL